MMSRWPEDWKPQHYGFHLLTGPHASCADPRSCEPYKVLEWPSFANGCRLTTYEHSAVPRWPTLYQIAGEAIELTGVILQGTLAELFTRRFSLRKGVGVLAHTTGGECNLEFHECSVCLDHHLQECICMGTWSSEDDFSMDDFSQDGGSGADDVSEDEVVESEPEGSE